jgi:DNA modification methylase
MQFHTKQREICAEPFSGSGTQIIAAEKLGRCCFACEIDARYVDAATLRWEEFSGKQATLDSTGQTFAEVRASRLGVTKVEVTSDCASVAA